MTQDKENFLVKLFDTYWDEYRKGSSYLQREIDSIYPDLSDQCPRKREDFMKSIGLDEIVIRKKYIVNVQWLRESGDIPAVGSWNDPERGSRSSSIGYRRPLHRNLHRVGKPAYYSIQQRHFIVGFFNDGQRYREDGPSSLVWDTLDKTLLNVTFDLEDGKLGFWEYFDRSNCTTQRELLAYWLPYIDKVDL
jgi:hypothetical protein